ncbi:symplekin isoform X2 [Tanacetum coccineum]
MVSNDEDDLPKLFNYGSGITYNYEAELKIDPTSESPHITNMYFKMSWAEYGDLSYLQFICLLIDEILVDREKGYVRVFLYPLESDFIAGRQFAIFIRKKDLYVVGLQDFRGNIYELGQPNQRNRYFLNSQPTGFGEQYEQLFKGSKGNLCGTWIGFEVLNEAIMRVMLDWNEPSTWAWSCGIFALMFSESCRFA